MVKTDSPAFNALIQATAGLAGGVFATVVLMPLTVAQTRIQVMSASGNKVQGPLAGMVAIWQGEGLAGLYSGLVAKCAETGSKNFVYFYIYDACNRAAKRRVRIGTAVNLVLGYVAGVGTTTLTMPLEVISTRQQTQKATSFITIVRNLVAAEGIGGLFRGYAFNICLCTNPAIQNTCFDQLKDRLLRHRALKTNVARQALSPLEAFFLGALAKTVATLLTYPLVRIKTIFQAGEADKTAKPRGLWAQLQRLYGGLGSALLKTVLQAALLYMMKDQIAGTVQWFFTAALRGFSSPPSRPGKYRALSGRPLAS